MLARGFLFSIALAACGGPLTYQLQGTQLSPGADAKVVAQVDDDRAVTKLTIDAKNIAPPDRLLPNGAFLVVWARKDKDAVWARLGALELDGDKRNGKAELTAALTAFDLIVSAETDAAPGSPSGKTVFEQRVEKK